jgi:hypothetical protein
MIALTPDWFQARWLEAKNRAGKRYTDHLNVDLPIAEYFGNLVLEPSFFSTSYRTL